MVFSADERDGDESRLADDIDVANLVYFSNTRAEHSEGGKMEGP